MKESISLHNINRLLTVVNSQVVILAEASGGYSNIITRGVSGLVSSDLSQLEVSFTRGSQLQY